MPLEMQLEIELVIITMILFMRLLKVKEMKNKEKYAKEIIELACDGYSIAIDKKSGRIAPCGASCCADCLFCEFDCHEKTREWAESEYIEKPVISKRDRAFLEYLRDRWKYMARDNISNAVYVFTEIPEKSEGGHYAYTGEARRISSDFNVVFPMVKWSNDKPWLIEDLKKLEVVEEYE